MVEGGVFCKGVTLDSPKYIPGGPEHQERMSPGSPIPSCSSAGDVTGGMPASFVSIREVLRGWRFSTINERRLQGAGHFPILAFRDFLQPFPPQLSSGSSGSSRRCCGSVILGVDSGCLAMGRLSTPLHGSNCLHPQHQALPQQLISAAD